MKKLDLTALLERVRNAVGSSIELDRALSEAFGERNAHGVLIVADRWLGMGPFTSSIDADVSLVEHVLPGWQYHMGSCGEDDMPWACITEPVEPCRDYAASAPEITIALLTALLIALTSNQEGNDEA